MIVEELIEHLQKYPKHMNVFLAEVNNGFSYDLLQSVRSETIDLFEEGNKRVKATDDVVILDVI